MNDIINKPKLTLAIAKAELAALGCTITKRGYDYVVRLKGSPAGSGYHTDGLEDAVQTGADMARRAAKSSVLSAVVNRCIAAGSPVVVERPARKEFVVASISTKANAFGLHGVILVAADGEAWEVGHCQCSPPESAFQKGQRLSFPVVKVETDAVRYIPQFVGCEIPRRLPVCPAPVVKEIFAAAK
jgi:hypothetical protein